MKKYIIYYGSGGLSHMMGGLFLAIYLAKSTERILIINLQNYSLFPFKLSKYFNIYDKIIIQEDWKDIPSHYNFFGNYIEELKNLSNFGYKNSGDYYFKDYILNTWIGLKKNLTQNIIPFQGYFPNWDYSSISLHLSIRNIVKNKCPPIKKPYISVHFRNTDLKFLTIGEVSKRTQVLSKKFNIDTLYLATDDYTAYNKLRQILSSNIKIIQYIKPENYHGKSLHSQKKDKHELTMNSFCDMYMILKSQYFIPCAASGFSKWLVCMIKNQKNIFNIKSNTQICEREDRIFFQNYVSGTFII
jgi:hypothetical protein